MERFAHQFTLDARAIEISGIWGTLYSSRMLRISGWRLANIFSNSSRKARLPLRTPIEIAKVKGKPGGSTSGSTGVSVRLPGNLRAKYPASGPHTTAISTSRLATARTIDSAPSPVVSKPTIPACKPRLARASPGGAYSSSSTWTPIFSRRRSGESNPAASSNLRTRRETNT